MEWRLVGSGGSFRKPGLLVAFDVALGRRLWSRPDLGRDLDSLGSVVLIHEKGLTLALDARSGRTAWSTPGYLYSPSASPRGGIGTFQLNGGTEFRELRSGRLLGRLSRQTEGFGPHRRGPGGPGPGRQRAPLAARGVPRASSSATPCRLHGMRRPLPPARALASSWLGARAWPASGRVPERGTGAAPCRLEISARAPLQVPPRIAVEVSACSTREVVLEAFVLPPTAGPDPGPGSPRSRSCGGVASRSHGDGAIAGLPLAGHPPARAGCLRRPGLLWGCPGPHPGLRLEPWRGGQGLAAGDPGVGVRPAGEAPPGGSPGDRVSQEAGGGERDHRRHGPRRAARSGSLRGEPAPRGVAGCRSPGAGLAPQRRRGSAPGSTCTRIVPSTARGTRCSSGAWPCARSAAAGCAWLRARRYPWRSGIPPTIHCCASRSPPTLMAPSPAPCAWRPSPRWGGTW